MIATISALIGIVMAAQVAPLAFAPHLVPGFQAAIMMLAFLIQDNPLGDKGIGLSLMLIAAIALLVGAALRMQEESSGFTPPAV